MTIHKRIIDKMAAGFPSGTFGRIDATLSLTETRTDFIRDAVERELKRRERLTSARAKLNSSRKSEGLTQPPEAYPSRLDMPRMAAARKKPR
ncbi:hypothetical protein [Bosea robiniae]|uniref:hypothetical protein n=1 Tax=Bosea robiniae TaxID=1036780 RepID=UPI0011142798|nr:hypothetical protein [Bosea robiniae]